MGEEKETRKGLSDTENPEMPVSPLPRTHLRIASGNLTASTATSYSPSMTMEPSGPVRRTSLSTSLYPSPTPSS